MPYVYLISAVGLMSVLSLLGTGFNRKNAEEKNIAPLYNFLLCSVSCLTWGVIYAFRFSFEPKVLLYSLGFGVCYALVMISLLKALAIGHTSLTALMQQLSLIGTTVWGFIFWGTWNTQKAPLIITGLVLVVVSLCLSLYSGKKSEQKISLKWAGYAFTAFFANAGCAIFQKQQQIDFAGEHGSMFMFFAVLLAAIICWVVFLSGEKPDVPKLVKTSWVYPLGAGMSNAVGNLFIVILATSTLSANLIYPAIAVGGLAITSLASAYFFKEKLAWWQWIGVAVGAVAVALLSIS